LISEIATRSAACAAAASFASTAFSTFLTMVFTLDLIALFLAALVWFTKILFFADLMLANLYTSNYVIMMNIFRNIPLESDTDNPTEHTHLFYAKHTGLSIHISQNIVKTRVDYKMNRKQAGMERFMLYRAGKERNCNVRQI
jgi:hypothetical protein